MHTTAVCLPASRRLLMFDTADFTKCMPLSFETFHKKWEFFFTGGLKFPWLCRSLFLFQSLTCRDGRDATLQ